MFRRSPIVLILIVLFALFIWNARYVNTESMEKNTENKKVDSVVKNEDKHDFFLEKPSHLVSTAPFKISNKIDAPVLERGKSGEWDSVDLLNPSVIQRNGKYYNYYSGYDGNVWRTGLAISEDGVKWLKYDKNPVLDISPNAWDSTYIAANGSAIEFNNKVFYFYQGQSKEKKANIGLAISEDGMKFQKQPNPVLTPGSSHSWDSNGVADPYVIYHNGYLYMYFLGMDDINKQRIGVARSRDGFTWEKYQENPILDIGSKGSFDENGLGEPSIVYYPPYFYMLYTGRASDEIRDVGLALSLDGVNWKKLNVTGLFKDRKPGTWDDSVICDTTLMIDRNTGLVNVWYGGGNKKEPAQNLNGNVGMFTIDLGQQRNLGVFDPNELSKNKQIDSTSILKGSYAIEGEEGKKNVWVSKESNITLKRSGNSGINVRGYVPLSAHKQVDKNINDITLTFLVNDQEVLSQTFNEDKSFDIKIDYSKIKDIVGNEEFFKFGIKSSHDFNPSKANISKDQRDLAFILNYIGMY